MAEAYDVAVAPHCPLGPIALASLQLDACTPNAVLQEQSLGIHYNTGRDLLDYLIDPEPLVLREGALAVPRGPGPGIEVEESRVREAARGGHRWRNPVWRHGDGTLAEW
jgi:galactonate dehydratase